MTTPLAASTYPSSARPPKLVIAWLARCHDGDRGLRDAVADALPPDVGVIVRIAEMVERNPIGTGPPRRCVPGDAQRSSRP